MEKTAFNPTYWRAHGFTSDPFAANSTGEFFVPAAWDDYLDILPQFARFCTSLVLVTGAQGVGKSTLATLFVNDYAQDSKVLRLDAQECSGVEYLLQLLHREYGAPYDPKSLLPVSEQLSEQLDELKINKEPRLLLIDNADQLPLDMRQACLQITQEQSALETCLSIILVGNEELAEQFNALVTPTTARECLHIINVAPFTEQQTQDYLKWCCNSASNGKSIWPFSDEDVATIFIASQGVVAKINTAAQQVLAAKQQPAMNWKIKMPKKVLWWGITLVGIIVLLFIFKYLSRPPTMTTTFAQPIPMRDPAQKAAANNTQQVGDVVVNTANTNADANNPAPAAVNTAPAAVNSAPVSTAPAAVNPAPANPSTDNAAATPAPSSETDTSAADTAPTQAEDEDNAANPNMDADDEGSVATPATVAPKKAAPVKHAAVKRATVKHAAPKKPVAKHAVAKKAPAAQANSAVFNTVMSKRIAVSQQRVLQINPKSFTLQLVGAGNLHAVQKYIIDHQLEATGMVLKTTRDGKPWYIVIHGVFPSRAAAESAGKQLSVGKVWVRPYSDLQHLLKQSAKK
jgi:DamX protein